jgi:protein involved in polysaccharide export with SLBB domain
VNFRVLALLTLTACVPSVPVAPPAAPGPRANQWLVEPGDVIRLRVWLAPDQSGDLPVNERGQVLVPTIGRMTVAGLTPLAVESDIVRKFASRLDSSRVEVTFLRPVSVVGGVKTPGIQLADPSASVLSLIARSGGPIRPGGDLRVYLLRIGDPVREISTADRVSDLGIRSTDQLYTEDPPFAVRNEIAIRTVTEAVSIVGSIVTIVLLITTHH